MNSIHWHSNNDSRAFTYSLHVIFCYYFFLSFIPCPSLTWMLTHLHWTELIVEIPWGSILPLFEESSKATLPFPLTRIHCCSRSSSETIQKVKITLVIIKFLLSFSISIPFFFFSFLFFSLPIGFRSGRWNWQRRSRQRRQACKLRFLRFSRFRKGWNSFHLNIILREIAVEERRNRKSTE